jgi:hypothetical protein
MSRRTSLRKDILGIAATSSKHEGRIAYVLFDRVGRVAAASTRSEMDVLGLVMAHELGHLLMPKGSHSIDGLMRAVWEVGDLRRERGHATFSQSEAQVIRQSLAR